jgi:hypothetical protein
VISMKKRLLPISLVLGFSILASVFCLKMYTSDLLGLEFMLDGKCSVAPHSMAYTGTGISAFFILPLFGLFRLINSYPIQEGFALSLFRPPVFHA